LTIWLSVIFVGDGSEVSCLYMSQLSLQVSVELVDGWGRFAYTEEHCNNNRFNRVLSLHWISFGAGHDASVFLSFEPIKKACCLSSSGSS